MEKQEFQFGRRHLKWPEKEGGYFEHRAAWDRLRQVCRELGCVPPSLEDVNEMIGLPEEFVLVADSDTGQPFLVNFDVGYRYQSKPYSG